MNEIVIIEIRSHNIIGLHIILMMFEKIHKFLYNDHSVKILRISVRFWRSRKSGTSKWSGRL